MLRPNKSKTVKTKKTTGLRALTVLGALAVAVMPMTGMATAQTAEAGSAKSYGAVRPAAQATPVGVWAVKATGDDGNVINTVLTFTEDGTVSNNAGTGTWKQLTPNSFSYHISERIYSDGVLVMSIEISQTAVLRGGNTFCGSGSAETFDPSGQSLGVTKVWANGTRQ